MKRVITAPATLAPAALDELKSWLAITTTRDDTTLIALIGGALDMCEAFTGQMPLEAECKEILPASGNWLALGTRPVQAITGVEGIPGTGPAFALASDAYEIDIDAEGCARIRLLRQGAAGRIAVSFMAGLAPDWQTLPDGIRHGLIRLAAHHFRQRDEETQKFSPPASVAALWRPWRWMRLL